MDGVSVKVRKKLLCFFFFFLKEGTICESPGVTEEDRKTPLESRCSGCSLEKFPQYKSGESHLGYNSISGFLVLEILSAGGKLFL